MKVFFSSILKLPCCPFKGYNSDILEYLSYIRYNYQIHDNVSNAFREIDKL